MGPLFPGARPGVQAATAVCVESGDPVAVEVDVPDATVVEVSAPLLTNPVWTAFGLSLPSDSVHGVVCPVVASVQ